jgi:quinoprotein glucose dehydrogenase
VVEVVGDHRRHEGQPVAELGDRVAHGAFLQAYDKATGELLAQVEVDRSLHSSPMTYLHEGRQYIVIAGGGGRGPTSQEPSELVAFALPR